MIKFTIQGDGWQATHLANLAQEAGFSQQQSTRGSDLLLVMDGKVPLLGKMPKVLWLPTLEQLDQLEDVDSRAARSRGDKLIKSVGRADAIICPSEFCRERVRFHFPHFSDQQLLVLPLLPQSPQAMSEQEYAPLLSELNINRPFFLHLDMVGDGNGAELSMRAFKHSQATQAGMLIIFIAPPGGNRKLERATAAHRHRLSNYAHELELEEQILWLDYLDVNQHRHNRLNALNSAADAVLAPHSYRCDPAPLYAALACAAPGIASRAGCHPEFLDGTWPLCDWDDYRSFSRAIDRQLIDPHHRRECSAAALNRARTLIAAPTSDRLSTFLNGLL